MLVSFTMRLSIDCRGCNISVAVNGITPSVRCYHCGQDNALDAGFWTGAFEPGYFAEAIAFEEGEGKTISSLGGGAYRLAYGKRTPRCQTCKGPDLDVANLGALVPTGRCFCPQCGASIRLRNADELARAINPQAVGIVGETTLSGSEQALQAKKTPILFSCMGCGGSLRVDGSTRAVACDHCGSSNYLPDGLWQQLNPVPREQVFFLICNYDDAAMQRRTDAMLADSDSDVRAALAADTSLPPDKLLVLARDSDSDVRAALAKNPAAPPQALGLLVGDDDEDVIAALLSRPDVPPDVVETIARRDDWSLRKLAAAHPACSLATLHRLAGDDDDDVKQAAHTRLAQLQAQGVDVSAGRGLLGKLFK